MRIFYILFILPVFAFCQTTFVLPTDVQSKGYSLAIGEYIKAIKAKDKTIFDTLFIGRHEEFPDITLQTTIENTKIVLLTSAEAEQKYTVRRSLIYINMMGNFTKDSCFFNLVAFKTEQVSEKIKWWPLHDYSVNFGYSLNTKVFVKGKSDFGYPYSNKYVDKK